MKISNNRLAGESINFEQSPNHSGKFQKGYPDTIIMHYTAGASAESSIKTLCDKRTKASAHVVIGRDGSITQLVPFNQIAWHAGKSAYMDRVGFNKYSIGIEMDNAGVLTKSGDGYTSWFGRTYPEDQVIEAVHRNQKEPKFWHKYTEEQISTAFELCTDLVEKFNIKNIFGHEEIAPERKIDPGPAFPLDKLRERVLHRERADTEEADLEHIKNAGVVTASKLNIRSGPGTQSKTIADPLSKGTVVDIQQESNGWYQVNVQIRGWVSEDYIKKS